MFLSMTSKIMVTLLLCWVSQTVIMALHLPLPLEPPPGNNSPFVSWHRHAILFRLPYEVRGVRVGIITAEDAALLRILAVRGRETVMVPMTGVSMTVTLGAGETWCAAATTASSSDTTTMTRMTAARGLLVFNKTHMLHINITFHHRRSLHMVCVVL